MKSLIENYERYEKAAYGEDVPASLEGGHSGSHIVGHYEHANQKEKVKRVTHGEGYAGQD